MGRFSITSNCGKIWLPVVTISGPVRTRRSSSIFTRKKGPRLLGDLNGQFAFAIWDANRQELFLARDRMGIRPLFYARAGNDWVFGSEIKAIFAHSGVSRKIDPVALDDIFTFWFPLSPRTAFEGIAEVPPAHSLTIDARGMKEPRRYWELPLETDPPGAHDVAYYADGLRDLMVDATRLQLRADVPVGAYLSGGLDSSVIASLVRHYTPNPLAHIFHPFRGPRIRRRRQAENHDGVPRDGTQGDHLRVR